MMNEPLMRADAPQEDTPLSEIIRAHMQAYFKSHGGDLPSPGIYDRLMPLFEKPLIEITLQATHGNQLKAARVLGINRNTLHKKLKEYGLDQGDEPPAG